MKIESFALEEKLHKAMLAWQEKHFTDYKYMTDHWSEMYKQPPFQLLAKIAPLKNDKIEVGAHRGETKFGRVKEMDSETRDRCLHIIRAQASTELGSIQQHRESLHKAQDERLQFDVLRVMAEEFRHGYQMMYLLANDDWGHNVAEQTIEELLAMRTGSHVLDAFNVFFDSFVDNIVFAAVIDRVGKYQLQMQQVFAYAPMSQSMGPMLSEEAFHLATGMNPLKQWVAEAATDRGNVSLECVQKHLNKWVPRGLEMFGDERGGKSNVDLGLKTMANAEAGDKYHREIKELVVDVLNASIVRARLPRLGPEETASAVRKLEAGESVDGLTRESLLYVPAKAFFRRRGVHAFEMMKSTGENCATIDEYLIHARRVLPDAYVSGRDFGMYVQNLQRRVDGGYVAEKDLPFFG